MSEWISVKDQRKPNAMIGDEYLSERILLYVPRFSAYQANPVVTGNYLFHSGKFRPDGSHGIEDYVTHWMPLPEPPK